MIRDHHQIKDNKATPTSQQKKSKTTPDTTWHPRLRELTIVSPPRFPDAAKLLLLYCSTILPNYSENKKKSHCCTQTGWMQHLIDPNQVKQPRSSWMQHLIDSNQVKQPRSLVVLSCIQVPSLLGVIGSKSMVLLAVSCKHPGQREYWSYADDGIDKVVKIIE